MRAKDYRRQVRIAKEGDDDSDNLCGPTTWISDTEIRCTLEPALVSPLEVRLGLALDRPGQLIQ